MKLRQRLTIRLFFLDRTTVHGGGLQVDPVYHSHSVRKCSYSQRTINVWNKLPAECVQASSVNTFKNRIDKYLVKAVYTIKYGKVTLKIV